MIDPLNAFQLPRQRLSLQAILTVGVLHVALLWLALQSSPAVQASRKVVMQYFSPITMPSEKTVVKPVAKPLAKSAPKPAEVPKPAPSAKPVEPPPQVAVPPPPPVEQAPAPVIQKLESVTPVRVPVKIQDIKAPAETRRTPELSNARIEPVLTPIPLLLPPEPPPAPPPAPKPTPAALPDPVPPPLPVPETPVPPAPPAPAPVPPVTAVPAPTPTPPPAPTAAAPRPAAITPVEAPTAPGGMAGSGAKPQSNSMAASVPTTAGGSGLNLNYNARPDNRGRAKTAAEMANEQLNGTGRGDKLAQGVNAAEKPDCVNSGQAFGLLAPIAIAYNVVKDKCK